MVNLTSDYEGFGQRFLSDHSTLFLILSNFIMILFAIYENWNLLTILFIYWCQSVIIGVFTFLKILDSKSPATTNKIGTAFFFLFHYGFFHYGYFTFLIANPFFITSSSASFFDFAVLIVIIVFFANHLYSFLYNGKKDANKEQNINKIMMFPYIRIIPMHLTIIFGSYFVMMGAPHLTLLLFLLLKTVVDVTMHVVEHGEFIAGKILITLDKNSYSPGEIIFGKLKLEFTRPVKAKSLKVAFIAEKILTQSSSSESKNLIFYNYEKTLDGEKTYKSETYDIVLQIPKDLLVISNDVINKGQFAQAKAFAEKFQKWGLNIYLQDTDRYYIKATLDIPMSIDISKTYDVTIS